MKSTAAYLIIEARRLVLTT